MSFTTCTTESVAPNARPGDGWHVGMTTGTGIDGAILHVSRIYSLATDEAARALAERSDRTMYLSDCRVMVRGSDYGRQFESRDAADAYKLERGYVRRYHTAADLRARRLARADDIREEMLAWKARRS
jgi:hypothetical protein